MTKVQKDNPTKRLQTSGFMLNINGEQYGFYEAGKKTICQIKINVLKNPQSDPYFPNLWHEKILVKATKAIKKMVTDINNPWEKALKIVNINQIHDDRIKALLNTLEKNTLTTIKVEGGTRNTHVKSNSKASAELDIRVFQETEKLIKTQIKKAVKDLPVEIEVIHFSKGFNKTVPEQVLELFEKEYFQQNIPINAFIQYVSPDEEINHYIKQLDNRIIQPSQTMSLLSHYVYTMQEKFEGSKMDNETEGLVKQTISNAIREDGNVNK